MELKEEMVSQQTVYEGIIVNVRRDKARLLDGRIANREVVEHPGGVAVFAMDGQGRVALLRQMALIHICRCRRLNRCSSRWSPYQ